MPRASGGASGSPQDQVEKMAAEILDKIPVPFDTEFVEKKFPIDKFESMNTGRLNI